MLEITAEIRNKLQRATTILEKVAKGESVPPSLAQSALLDLKKIEEILKKLVD